MLETITLFNTPDINKDGSNTL